MVLHEKFKLQLSTTEITNFYLLFHLSFYRYSNNVQLKAQKSFSNTVARIMIVQTFRRISNTKVEFILAEVYYEILWN